MPTTYAHYRFGDDALKTLPKKYQDIVSANRKIYDMAVHGPDIFFYCVGNVSKDTAALGHDLHHQPGRYAFEMLKKNSRKADGSYSDEDLSYIIGFLSHYVLDSHCHPFVGRRIMEKDISHNALEAQFDAHLIRKDGMIPQQFSRAKLINADARTEKTISEVYAISADDTHHMLKSMRLFIKLLHIPPFILKPVMRLTKTDKHKDLIVYNDEAENCIASNLRLDKLYQKALSSFPNFFQELTAFLDNDQELPEYFDKDFEKGKNYKEIPLFSAEEETKYTV